MNMGESGISSLVVQLIEKGVSIPNPETVYIDPSVDIQRISSGAMIYPGCRIYGAKTLICDQAKLGYEQPLTVEDCWIGPRANLKGGFCHQTVFLAETAVGSGAHIREGSILEERASVAHTVGLKQTILFPFVTLGSLINFCDCFMAGGTDRYHHSEVGSSFIHFNFTPNQDKATPSLFGDVPRGVMLNRPPIFLGGQGGVVGPCRLAFGTVTAAGSIIRKDEHQENMLIIESSPRNGRIPYFGEKYHSIQRIVTNNIIYIGNLFALRQWYRHVRSLFITDFFTKELHAGLTQTVELAIAERIHRLAGFSANVVKSVEALKKTVTTPTQFMIQQTEFIQRWPAVREYLSAQDAREGNTSDRETLLNQLRSSHASSDYIASIRTLPDEIVLHGIRWLQQIVDQTIFEVNALLPSFHLSTHYSESTT